MRIEILLLAAFTCSPLCGLCSPQAPAEQAAQPSASSNRVEAPKPPTLACSTKAKLRPGFLIIGTVFNEHAFSFPGSVIRIRCAEDKKFRWEAVSNARGEFAVRVPEGHNYEVLVQARNYQPQTIQVLTENGDGQQRLSVKLQPLQAAVGKAKP